MPDSDGYDDFIDMGDEGGDGGDEGGGGGGGGLKKMLPASLFRILLYVGAGIVVFIIALLAGRMGSSSASKEQVYKKDRAALVEKKPPLATFNLKQFMANTADTDMARLVRIKMQIAYEKNNIKLQTELNARRTQLRDAILLFFNDKKKEQMDTALRKRELKKHLIKKINQILIEGQIKDIYYEEFSVN